MQGGSVAQVPGSRLLYELVARPQVVRLSNQLGRPASLADLPDEEIDRLAALGFDHVWLMGVWDAGTAGGERTSRCLLRLPSSRIQFCGGRSSSAVTKYREWSRQ